MAIGVTLLSTGVTFVFMFTFMTEHLYCTKGVEFLGKSFNTTCTRSSFIF